MNPRDLLIVENRKIYAQLMAVREERKKLQSHLDIEIALCGSHLYHHNEVGKEALKKVSMITTKLICLYEKYLVLINNFNDNLTEIKKYGTKTK